MKEKVFKYWDMIERRANRRFPDPNLSDQALLFVVGRLEENNWHRLKAYDGRAKFSTFLYAVCTRLLEDFARQHFGRRRPPQWITALGGMWVRIFRLLCLERFSVTDVVEHMAVPGERTSGERVEEAARTILGRVTDCGQARGEVRAEDGDAFEGKDRDAETARAEKEKNQVMSYIFDALVRGKDRDAAADCPRLLWGVSLSRDLEMPPKDRLLLRLIYQDGIPVSKASRMLELTPHQGHGRLRRLKEKLLAVFETAGLLDDIKLMLNE